MHDAFRCYPILEKLPLQIDCIANEDESLLVATNRCQLLVYNVQEEKQVSSSGDKKFAIEIKKSNKSFSRKTVSQLCIVKELNIIISLSDGTINVHDFSTFTLKFQISRAKGASYFALDVKTDQNEKAKSSQASVSVRLCAVVKRKLMTFQWQRGMFEDLNQNLGVSDVPKSVAWIGDYICTAVRKEYFLIETSTGSLIDLFSSGKTVESLICPLPNDQLALNKDEITVCISLDEFNAPKQEHAATWKDVPTDIGYVNPYFIALLPKHVEIRSHKPRLLIQQIDLSKPRSIYIGSSCHIASHSYVWRLLPVPLVTQIDELQEKKQFELAIKLCELMDSDKEEKEKYLNQIKMRSAFDLFCKKKFDMSLKLFRELKADPTFVIGLYPNLLPEDYRKQIDYPEMPSALTGGELEKGLSALTEYLTRLRNEKTSSKASEDNPDSLKMLLQIIDTSLLKCYLQINEGMVAPLLRLRDNNCHLEEAERVLNKVKKYPELVLLYQSKGAHKKALELLLRQADKPSSSLGGHLKTVEYLQKLGPQYLSLILEYSVWVLKKFPADGIRIFTEDLPEVEALPRKEIFQHIETYAQKYCMEYLEHIIFDWREESPELHNRLVVSYQETLVPLLREHLQSLPEGCPPPEAGKEPDEVGDYHRRMLFFLQTSSHYQPMKLLRNFPLDLLHEERALLLGRAARHEEALAIYIHVLKDTKLAEQYCRRQYEENIENSRHVYINLLKMYLKPNEVPLLGLGQSLLGDAVLKPNFDAAISVLNNHYRKIDVDQALELIPASFGIKEICTFFLNVLSEKMVTRRSLQLFKSLLYAEHLQVHEQRIFHQKRSCVITEEKMCIVCHKKIGLSAFACYPNGTVVHYYCCKDRRHCPDDNQR